MSSCFFFPWRHFPGMGLAYLMLLPEGSVALSHINSFSENFSFLISFSFPISIHFPITSYGRLFDGPWKKLWPVCPCGDMTDYRWLFLCLFWVVAIATAVSSGRLVMACLVLRILKFPIKTQEYKWSFIIFYHIPRILAIKRVTLISYEITGGQRFRSVQDVGDGKMKKGDGLVGTGR